MQNREIHIKGLSEEAPLTAEGLDVQLKIAQGDNLRLKAELSEVKEKAEEVAVISIMNLLNSEQGRFTLDRILTTTSLLATIRNEGNTEFKPNGTLALLNICKNLISLSIGHKCLSQKVQDNFWSETSQSPTTQSPTLRRLLSTFLKTPGK